jgi:hypothetical protein
MRFYLDNCCLNRPFDDQTQYRIHLESEAVISILRAVEESRHQLISSDILRLENSKNRNYERRDAIDATLDKCLIEIRTDEKRIGRCQELLKMDFSVYDAFHLASAEAAGVDVFSRPTIGFFHERTGIGNQSDWR